ncbi:MAG: hypothetical protein EXR98_20145 [Gemmataceae bacterium]|nr:hypothetical protein [Gemmataceae bacterium]
MPDPSQRPPIASAPLSVILLAHALDTETPEALGAWRQYLDTLKRPTEIILIQETRPEVATSPSEVEPASIRTIAYERATGFRDALNDAIRSAQYPLIAYSTCDKQYQPADLDRMLKLIDQVDMVVGYRAGGPAPAWRVLLDTLIGLFSRVVLGIPVEPRKCWLGPAGWGRRWIARWFFGIRASDPECPLRLARRAIFEHLPIQSGGPFVAIEILAKANHLTCYIAESPVTWTPPASPSSDAITFSDDGWLVFRLPDFGPTSGNEPRGRTGSTGGKSQGIPDAQTAE